MRLHTILSAVFMASALFFTSIATANDSEIEQLLELEKAPAGVVFETVSGDENYLKTALDKFERYKKQLREKFPEIKMAIVSHGREQFALTTANKKKYAGTHKRVAKISEEETPVHICVGHASWYDIKADDFPEYVKPAAGAPAQIREYQNKGYQLIIL